MKRRYIFISAVLLLALCVFSHFHVNGRELTPVASLTDNYICTVTKTKDTIDGPTTDYTLTGDQILLLRDLISESSFTRIPSNSYTYRGQHDRYSFFLELKDNHGLQKDYILIDYVEDLFLSISAPYDDLYITLKIKNPQWHELLESILNEN